MADRIQPSGLIGQNTYLVKLGFVAMYLVDAGDCLIAFDTGMSSNATLAELRRMHLDPARVKHVILTHSDRDHVGGLAAFPDAKVYLPKAESAMLDRTNARFFGFVYNRPLPVEHELLDDNAFLSIGNTTIKCLSTPGHTVGSMSFLVNGSVLVVGDILNLRHKAAVMDRGFLQLDKHRQRDSIVRLSRLAGVSLLCTAHSGYTEDFAGAMRQWLSGAEGTAHG